MKKLVMTLVMSLVLSLVTIVSKAGTDPVVKDTTIKTVVHKIYMRGKGGRYIIRTSAKSGKEYKQYLKKAK